MNTDRRSLLKVLSVLPLAGLPMAGLFRSEIASAGVMRFVADERFPDGKRLAAAASREGRDVTDPRGEIVAHFLGKNANWLEGQQSIVGITSYTDMMLMGDLARSRGRRMTYAAALHGGAPALVNQLDETHAQFVTTLRSPTVKPGQATAFLWMV